VCTAAFAASAALLVGLGGLARTAPAPSRAEEPRTVSREEIVEAMRHSHGYRLEATANGARLQAEVLLRLIRAAERTDEERRPLRIGHREWFEAFLERTGLPASKAPLYVRLPHEVGQDIVADYRRERVIARVRRGPEPVTVANVHIFWEDGPRKPDRYSYDDLLSSPNLRVTQEQNIRYRLVDYGDRLWYAEVSGLHGRPTSGPLGLLFDIIGEARVLESCSAFAPDGYQVARGRANKLFITRSGTITIRPDGRADKDVPEDRPDLQALLKRLKEPLEIDFAPIPGAAGEDADPP
jgi:hypothetical protein